MSNSLKANTKAIPEMDEEDFDDDDNDNIKPSNKMMFPIKQRGQQENIPSSYTKSISSMDKMIVKIGGNENGGNPQNASVYSGRLLIEVAGNDDYRKSSSNTKANRRRGDVEYIDSHEYSNGSSRNFKGDQRSSKNQFNVNG